MLSSLRRIAFIALFPLSLWSVSAWADVTGRISGTIKDPSGALIPRVGITVVNEETGIKDTTQSNDQGFYAFPSLPVGKWDLEVRHQGFRDYRQTGLVLDVNTALMVDVVLVLGSESQTVLVEASPVQVDTTSTQMGEVITTAKMETVPLNGRSYTDLLALQPGVAPVSSGQYNAIHVSGNLNPGSLSVSGQREGSNGFMVNGGNVNEGAYMGTAVVPNLDSIAEFRILTNNSDAEYGNYSGGLINAITKSGTNQVHGSVFEFLRNTDLDARNFYSPAVGKFIQNQFGGTLGGPLIKDKLFIFGDYQGTRQIVGLSTGNIPVPSPADRAGNLSDLASHLTGSLQGPYWAQQLSQKLGYSVTQGEPYYRPGCTSATCVFPNAQIPAPVITTPSQRLLKYIPLPNAGAYFSTAANNQTLRDDKGGIKVDYNSRFGMISGYYFADDFLLDNPYGGGSVGGFASGTKGRSQMINVGDTKTFGANKVNELRLHFMRFAYSGNTPEGGVGVSLSSLGFVTGANTSGIDVTAPSIEGVPPISFNSFSIGEPGAPTAQYDNTYQIADNFSIVKGAHTIKFGGDTHYDQITHHGFGQRNGVFSFTGSETGSDWADFLIGAPSSFEQGVQLPLHTRSKYFALYAQDSWRARSDLTVNLGLRWEASEPWYEAQGQLETIVPGEHSLVFPGSPAGWVFPGDPGIPKTIAPTAGTISRREWAWRTRRAPIRAYSGGCWEDPVKPASGPVSGSITQPLRTPPASTRKAMRHSV
ncbi:MAG: carboxypeptidase regulatory-like domain-containing protein, partial [Bryobacteraceae bacterium]